MKLTALPALVDNCIWMLDDGHRAIVVDPGEAAPVVQALDGAHLELAAILVTHHHGDHVGGLAALQPRLAGPVVAPAREAIAGTSLAVAGGAHVDLLGRRFEVLDVPGHTAGHVAYFDAGDATQEPILFCGDTLFSAGCGRLFEGTPAQMHRSLSLLAALPESTRVCCAHEYTVANLRFAAAVEPDNAGVRAHAAWCEARRAAGQPTLPSTLQLERSINPFLRTGVASVARAARAHGCADASPVEVFRALRAWKNEFR